MVCDDLLTSSRITTTARAQGHRVAVVRMVGALPAAIQAPVFADLSLIQNDLQNLRRITIGPVIVFGSHVDAEGL
ncbi:MAG: hypothetical protein ACRCZF_03820, partial [Gemmataceae bacterium]